MTLILPGLRASIRPGAIQYRVDLARPKPIPTPAQLDAVAKALAARRVCAACGPVPSCVRTTDGLCGDCYLAGASPVAHRVPTWEVLQAWQTRPHPAPGREVA